MEYRRILCSFLNHSEHISHSTRRVLPALLSSCYNPEGLSRSIVATITSQLAPLNEELEYGLSIEEVQDYWFSITLDYQPAFSYPGSGASSPHYDSTNIRPYHPPAESNSLPGNTDVPSGEASHPPVAHHPNPNVDHLLATSYNNVMFTWMTDFLLYPLKKRADLLVPRHRHRLPPQRAEPVKVEEENVSRPSKRSQRLPRQTPPPPSNPPPSAATAQAGSEDAGLAGCKFINDVVVDGDASQPGNRRTSSYDAEAAFAQWNGARDTFDGEDFFGEALELRVGNYRDKLKQDLIRRDGPWCAASQRPTEPLFCTQIIPESADSHRFARFRRMVSVFFAGHYDHLLGPPPSPSSIASDAMEIDHSLGPSSSQDNRRTRRRGHYPVSENILRSSRNAINLSEQWMRWLDEGRITIREQAGQFYIVCLDPSLYHDPSFSRPDVHPSEPWESRHWLRLQIGATSGRDNSVQPHRSPIMLPPISTLTSNTMDEGSLTLPSLTSATAISSQDDHQLPTPIPTPTTPPPIVSPFELEANTKPVSHFRSPPVNTHAHMRTWSISTTERQDLTVHMGGVIQPVPRETRRIAPPKAVASRLMKPAARAHPYANSSRPSTPTSQSRWQSHSDLHDIRNPSRSPRLAESHSSRFAPSHLRSGSASSSASIYSSSTSQANFSLPSIASLLNSTPAISRPQASSHSPRFPMSSLILSEPYETKTSAPASRKELWDVDALDPNLTRLHEQIVTTWWATGLAQEVNTQMKWVDELPLPEMNIVVLGQAGFTSILKHKLTLL